MKTPTIGLSCGNLSVLCICSSYSKDDELACKQGIDLDDYSTLTFGMLMVPQRGCWRWVEVIMCKHNETRSPWIEGCDSQMRHVSVLPASSVLLLSITLLAISRDWHRYTSSVPVQAPSLHCGSALVVVDLFFFSPH